MNRRKLMQACVTTAVVGAAPIACGSTLAKTPRDFTGPFYPRGARHGKRDLIVGEPVADVLEFSGRVCTPLGVPRIGSVVDIWHADPNGRYKHPRDRDQDQLMDSFLYWGQATTDAHGDFAFRTYVPGRYSARPAQHIHFKVWSGGNELLTSQVYFAELGGARGLARSDAAAALQTINIKRVDDQTVAASLQVVV